MGVQLFIMAAGLGSRFGGLKQLEAVGPSGESLLEYSLYDALEAGFSDPVVVIRPSMAETFSEVLLSRLPAKARPSVVFQEDPSPAPHRQKPWGTGHALLCAEKALKSPFAVINADDFYGRRALLVIRRFLESAESEGTDYCMAGYRLDRVLSPHGSVSRGICRVGTDGTLIEIREHKALERRGDLIVSIDPDGRVSELDGGEVISMNLWGFTPSVFPLARPIFRRFLRDNRDSESAEFYLPHLVRTLVSEGRARVHVLPVEDRPLGLTFRQDLEDTRSRIQALTAEGRYPSPLWSEGSARPAGRNDDPN